MVSNERSAASTVASSSAASSSFVSCAGTSEVNVGTRTPRSVETIISAAAAKDCGVNEPLRIAGSRSATIDRTSTCMPAT